MAQSIWGQIFILDKDGWRCGFILFGLKQNESTETKVKDKDLTPLTRHLITVIWILAFKLPSYFVEDFP